MFETRREQSLQYQSVKWFVSGGVAGVCTSVLNCPSELITIQATVWRNSFKDIIRSRGVRFLYTGWSACLSREVVFGCIFFPSRHLIQLKAEGYRGERNGGEGYRGQRNRENGYRGERNRGEGYRGQRNRGEGDRGEGDRENGYRGERNRGEGYRGQRNKGATKLERYWAGLLSGVLASLLTTPFDVMKTRMQSISIKEGTRVSLGYMFSHIVREEGTQALWRGLVPRLISIPSHLSFFYLCFEIFARKQ